MDLCAAVEDSMPPTTLDVIDLDATDEAVYLAIVSDQPVTQQELGQLSGKTEFELRRALSRLLGKGLVDYEHSGSDRLVAAPPDVALEALLLHEEERMTQARHTAIQLAKLHRSKAPHPIDQTGMVEVISGRDAILRCFSQLQRTCRTELRIIDKPPFAALDPNVNVETERELTERGVRIRAIFDPRGLKSFHHINGDVRASINAGVEARTLPLTPTKLVLADDQLAMLPLHAEIAAETMLIVRSPGIVTALSVLFEQMWDQALPLGPTHRPPVTSRRNPSDDELKLLNLLTAGLNDEVIARHLGISQRTMQRRMKSLLERLGATSRFQAALRAIALDWLAIPPSSGSVFLEA